MLFGVRGTGGWGECLLGTGQTHLVGALVCRSRCSRCSTLEVQEHIHHQGGNHTVMSKKSDDRWPVNNKKPQATVDAQGKPLGERVRVQPLIALRKQPMP